MKALFVVWRLAIVAAFAYGVAHAPSPGVSVLCMTGALFFVADTLCILVAARGRGR